MMFDTSRRLALSVAIAGAATLAGCGYNNTVIPVMPTPLAHVMVLQASPNTPKVDIWLDGAVGAGGVGYLNGSGYLTAGQSTARVQLIPSGGAPLLDTSLPVSSDAYYTVFASDSLSRIKPVVLLDDRSVPPDGKTRIRFVALEPATPVVDFATTGGPVIAAAVPFQGSSGWMLVDPGLYAFEARVAGSATVVATLTGINITAGHVYTLWVYGASSPNGPRAPGFVVTLDL